MKKKHTVGIVKKNNRKLFERGKLDGLAQTLR